MATPPPVLVYLLDYPILDEHIALIGRLIPTIHTTHRIVIVTPHIDIPQSLHQLSAQYPDIEVVALDMSSHTSWLVRVRAFVAFLRDTRAPCVHLWLHTWPAQTALLVALRIMRIQRVIVSVDQVPTIRIHTHIMHLVNKYIARIPHLYVVYGAMTKQQLVQQYAVPDARIAVIPLGIDDKAYHPHAVTALPRSTYDIPNTGFLVVVCAPLHEDYGHDILIRAMSTVWHYHPTAHLLIAGEGAQATQLRTLATHTPQPQQIHFAPPPHDVATVFASADVVVYPARQSRMPQSLLIAMALERPVIGSAIPNIQEIIEANGNGLLTRPNDPDALASTINRLLNDPALRIELAINARTRVTQRFRADVWIHAMCACYRMI